MSLSDYTNEELLEEFEARSLMGEILDRLTDYEIEEEARLRGYSQNLNDYHNDELIGELEDRGIKIYIQKELDDIIFALRNDIMPLVDQGLLDDYLQDRLKTFFLTTIEKGL